MARCSKEALRIVLWMSWVTLWLFNSIFVVVTLISFSQLWEASSIYLGAEGTNVYTNRSWRAPMATCILSSLLVIGYDLMSCVTLIKKSINRAGPGFGYGFIVAFCFCLSFFLLLCGLVLNSFRSKVQALADYDWTFNGTKTGGFKWENYDTQTFVGAEVLALINFVVLLLFAILLVVLQSGVSDQLGIEKTQYAPLEGPGLMGAAGQDGYAEGLEQGHNNEYGYTVDGTAPHDGEYAGSTAYYGQGEYAAAGGGTGGSTAYYGSAGYAAPAEHYAYDSGVQDPQPQAAAGTLGSGLLGGQVLGTAPAGPPPAYAPPPAHTAYQQF